MTPEMGADWKELLNASLRETDVTRLKHAVEALESAMFTRCLELEPSSDGEAERSEIRQAAKSLLQLKVENLGFPVNSSIRPHDLQPRPETHSRDSGS